MYIEDLKFSLWADFIERDYLDNEFKDLIDKKIINGATSNPAIFKNAILTSLAYKEQLNSLGDISAKDKYEAVAIYDIKKAADILRPLYDAKDDGYVSIEVDPFFCDDANATISEGKRLFKTINCPNIMIKVPATTAGYIAMEELTSVGIPVNATLVFKKEQAIACANAFKRGVYKYDKIVDTVISIFVSRIDRALDKELTSKGIEPALCGIYNTASIYATLQQMDIKGCRALFASTGVKDDSLAADYYIKNLLAFNTVNTAPVDTIIAFAKNSITQNALPIKKETIDAHFSKIKEIGINFEAVLDTQIEEGLEAFKDAFKEILESI
ncbi:Transaldolase [hydrothermal vent metagenome]|uniref:Transaldolase n=1 Tax=hydrothermal vent metagenome TaxID=652676 RepID=A0A1W1CTE8_9ZZZZ